MPANQNLIQRSGDLKRDLLEFGQGPRFDRALQQAVTEHFGPTIVANEGEVGNFLDWFILQHRLSDGRTVVDHFVSAHPKLPEAERAMLLGWQGVVEGIFAVQRQDGDALIVVNLVDELTYRVHSTMGPPVFNQMPLSPSLIPHPVPI